MRRDQMDRVISFSFQSSGQQSPDLNPFLARYMFSWPVCVHHAIPKDQSQWLIALITRDIHAMAIYLPGNSSKIPVASAYTRSCLFPPTRG